MPRISSRTRARRLSLLGAAGALIAALLVHASFASAVPSAVPSFVPTADDGVIAEGSAASMDDVDLAAIARLDPALRDAMRRASADAAADGVGLEVTSGWRSAGYQQWLLDRAIDAHGSEEVARRFVATPDRSSHVPGKAVDIGPADAQFWLIQHGARYGICQTYANERWHFELATSPGGVCPEMKSDAAS